MGMKLRGATPERVLRRVVRTHPILLHRHHREVRKQAFRAHDVRVLGCGQAPRALGEDQYPLLRTALLTIERPVDQAAVISPGDEIHGGGRRRVTHEKADATDRRSRRRSVKHDAPSSFVEAGYRDAGTAITVSAPGRASRECAACARAAHRGGSGRAHRARRKTRARTASTRCRP